jgi:DNA-binding transcriptional MocR family regulator
LLSFDYPLTWMPEKDRLKKPYYLSIADMIAQDVAQGILKAGTQLPSQRDLARYLEVNFSTVTRAYRASELKGLTSSSVGKGTFITPNASKTATITANDDVGEFIDLGFGASFEECNEMLTEEVQTVCKKRYVKSLLNYDNPTGMFHQKAVGAQWMSSFGIKAEVEQIAITSGGQNAITVALAALFEPGDSIAVDLFTYPNFIELSKLLGVRLVAVPSDSSGMIPEELNTLCHTKNIKGMFLMPSCINPTSIKMPPARRREIAALAEKHELVIIEDDSYAFLAIEDEPDYFPIFNLVPERCVYISSVSKPVCSGLRVAYMVFTETYKDKLLEALFNINVKTSSLDAEIITQSIISGKAQEIIDERKRLAREANVLYTRYFHAPSANELSLSYFRWLALPKNVDGKLLQKEAMRQGVRVFHSDRFTVQRTARTNDHLRISLSAAQSMNRLEIGLKKLSALVSQY